MASVPCSVCRKRLPARLAALYWAIFEGDGSRAAHKQRVCRDDYIDLGNDLLDAVRNADYTSNGDKCPSCGVAEPDRGCQLFVSVFAPNRDPERLQLELCRKCFPTVLARTKQGSTPLMDRGVWHGEVPDDGW